MNLAQLCVSVCVCVCGFTCQLRLLFNLCPTATQQRVPQTPLWDNYIFAVYLRNSWCHTCHGSGSLQMVLVLDTTIAFSDILPQWTESWKVTFKIWSSFLKPWKVMF